jgi:hypothetical protein
VLHIADTIDTTITFTPTYSNVDPTGSVGGQTNVTFFELKPNSGGNTYFLAVTLQTLGFGDNQANVILSTGVAYGGSSTSGTSEYTSTGVDSLSGVTMTLKVSQVLTTNLSGDPTITTTGTLFCGITDLQNFDYVTTANFNLDCSSGYCIIRRLA